MPQTTKGADNMIFLGHYEEDIFHSLAKEEAMTELAKKEGVPLFFTSRVLRPTITLAENEEVRDVRAELCRRDGIHLTRRIGPGSVIWLDSGVLNYFFASPKTAILEEFRLHTQFAGKIAQAIKGLGAEQVYVGEKFSIAFSPGPSGVIAGNAAILKRDYFLYHGILALERWNIEELRKYLVLRRNESVDEEKLIAELPYVYQEIDRRFAPQDIVLKIAKEISGDSLEPASEQIREAWFSLAEPLIAKYQNPAWIFKPPRAPKDSMGFCLIALSESWKEKNFYPV